MSSLYLFPAIEGFTLLPPIVCYLNLLQVFYPTFVPWIFKKTKSNFFTIQSPCRQRRKPLSTDFSSVHLGTMTSLKSMRVRKCRDHLQATRGLGYFHSSPRQMAYAYLCSTSLIGRIYLALVSTRRDMTFDSLWMPITICCDESNTSDT